MRTTRRCRHAALLVLCAALCSCSTRGFTQGSRHPMAGGERVIESHATSTPQPTSMDSHIEPVDPRVWDSQGQ